MSSLKPDDIEKNLQKFTNTFELFTKKTFYPSILCLNLGLTGDRTNVTNILYAKLKSTTSSLLLPDLYSALLSATTPGSTSYVTNNSLAFFKNQAIYNSLFSSAGTVTAVIPSFITRFQHDPLPNISTFVNSDTPAPSMYETLLQETFKNIFVNMSNYMYTNSSQSIGQDFQKTVSESTTNTDCTELCKYIKDHIYTYISSATTSSTDIDSYINNIYTDVVGKLSNINSFSMSISHFNLFFLCFLPYFYFLYMYYLLPTATLSSTYHGSRDGIVRRYTILAFYKYMMYVFFATYKLSALVDPGSQSTMLLRSILDTNMTSLFDQDAANVLSSNMIEDVSKETQNNMNKMSSLQVNNNKIVSNRQNLNNILILQKKASADLNTAIIIKWVWFTVLMLYIGAAVAVYFLREKKFMIGPDGAGLEIFFIISLVLGFIIMVLGMIAIVRSSA